MKNITAIIITLAMLCAVSCNGNTTTPAQTTATTSRIETTATTVGSDAPIAPPETTTETTAPAPTEEPFDATAAFLSTVPVYEYSYEDNRYFNCFDKIGAAEYAKYAAGEEFDEYFAIKFTEYPDIAIIGQVVTEPGLDSVYDQRVMDSVIRNGERHYLTENKYGPGFYAYVTEDFVCITMAASGIGGAFYAYDGGAEHHTPSDVLNDSVSFVHLYEKDGTMQYMIYSRKYDGVRHSYGPLAYGDLNPEDHFYDKGTVQLVDGKIKYIADVSYTIGEWFEADGGPKENTGCNTLEEYQEYLQKEMETNTN